MQQRKPIIYCWSFKFSERDKVSFPDITNMKNHHRFFENRESKSTLDQHDATNLANESKHSTLSPPTDITTEMSPSGLVHFIASIDKMYSKSALTKYLNLEGY